MSNSTTPFQFLQQIAGDKGRAFVRMKHEATGEIKGHTLDLGRVENPESFSANMRRASEEGWSVWAMVSETHQGDAPLRSRVIWADLDWDKYPLGKSQVQALIAALPVAPSLVVESGHGNHLYWFLDRAISPSQAREIAKGVAWELGADPLYAPNHKMRVPGTVNPKHLGKDAAAKGYTTPVECRSVGGNGQKYTPDALPIDAALVKLPHGVMKKLVRGPETPATTDKSAYDHALCLTMLENGLNATEIEHLMGKFPASGKAQGEGHNKRNYIQRTIQSALKVFGNKGQPHKPVKDVTPVVWTRKTYRELLEAPRPTFLVQDFLPHNGIALIAAPPKARKSWASMQLAYSMALGQDWLGFQMPQARKVLYVQAELPDDVVAARFEQMYGTADSVENLQFIRVPTADLTLDEHLQGLLAEIKDFGAELVIIDPIANFWQGDENSASSVNALFDKLALIQDAGCGVVLVHHSRKTQGFERITPQHMRGSSVFFARPDAVMTISPTQENYSWADFTLRAAAPRDGVRLFIANTGAFTLEGTAHDEEVQKGVEAGMRALAEKRRKLNDKGTESGKQVGSEVSRLQFIKFEPDGREDEVPQHVRTTGTSVGVPRVRQDVPARLTRSLPPVPVQKQVNAGD